MARLSWSRRSRPRTIPSMQRHMMKSKIHRARVTECDLNYIGSVTIDADLLNRCDLWPNEKVLIINLENGSRIETYALEGKARTGVIGMNGGCARHCQIGDRVIIMAFAHMTDREAQEHKPKVVFVDDQNKPIEAPHIPS